MINFVVFGAGRIGKIHAKNLVQSSGASIRYVVDVNAEYAQALASECGAEVSTIEDALADPEIHAAIIASSTDTHADLIERSALAGKAVFCEKPIDLNAERVRKCLEVVNDTGVLAAIGFNRRFDAQFSLLRDKLVAGDIGAVELVSITSRDPSPPDPAYIKVSGGLFRDMMIHDLDMARWLLGEEPSEVYAAASCMVNPEIGELGDIDTALVVLKTASGKMCQINNSRRAVYGYDQRLEVFGSKGMIQANNNLESNLVITGDVGSVSAKPLHFFLERYADAYKKELSHFLDCVTRNAKPIAGMEDGLQALLLADAAAESFAIGKVVQL